MKLIIPGPPVAWLRPRVNTRQGRPIIFEHPKVRSEKGVVQHHAQQLLNGSDPISGPVKVKITAEFACPKSQYRKQTPRLRRWKDNGPDIDNLAKFYLDALTGIAFLDDRQVCSLMVTKHTAAQGKPPRTIIQITEIEGVDE